MMRRATLVLLVLALAACSRGRHVASSRDECAPPVAALPGKPGRTVIQWQSQYVTDLLSRRATGRFREVHSNVLTNEQVTRDRLLAALRNLEHMAPDDLAIVLIAGHGAKPSPEEDMRFLTTEATFDAGAIRSRGIGWGDIADALARHAAESWCCSTRVTRAT